MAWTIVLLFAECGIAPGGRGISVELLYPLAGCCGSCLISSTECDDFRINLGIWLQPDLLSSTTKR